MRFGLAESVLGAVGKWNSEIYWAFVNFRLVQLSRLSGTK
jgi:hypothetical protein